MSDVSMFQSAAELEFFIELIEENRSAMTIAARSVLSKSYSGYIDDAVQEACISIANNIFSIKNRLECSKRRAFCVRVTRNKCIDIIRRNSKYSVDAFDDVAYALESANENPLDEMLRQERFEEIVEAINALDENYSSVLKYKLIDGFSDTEIAAILGITPKNVNVRTFRAKQKLRQLLHFEREGDENSENKSAK